jgi:hypothetical protein
VKKSLLLRMMSFYPPYFGAGIRTRFADDLSWAEVSMKLRFWNKNYFGTQFGGSMYSMVDPFYALLMTEALGRGFVVWDKAATIRFKRPGTGTVRARFELTSEQVAEVREQVELTGKAEPVFLVKILDSGGKTIAEVEKVLSVQKRVHRAARQRGN